MNLVSISFLILLRYAFLKSFFFHLQVFDGVGWLLLLLLLSLLLLLIRVFHISVSWWSFTGDWVTASLFKSPGLFSVFCPFSIMLLFGWSLLVLLFLSPPVSSLILLGCQLPNLPGPLIILYLLFNHYYYYYSLRFFHISLVYGLSLEFEWPQVSSSCQDSSQYSGRSQ